MSEQEIIMTGDLTINRAAEIKAQFLNMLDTLESIEIKHQSIDQIDTSYIQLLIGLINSSKESGKEVKIFSDDEGNLKRANALSGEPLRLQ